MYPRTHILCRTLKGKFKPSLVLLICALLSLENIFAVESGGSLPADSLIAIAEEGDAPAQLQLGTIYLQGSMGVEKDYTKATYWFSQAAKQNLPEAQYNLGLCYEQGLGVEHDANYALVLYRSAADRGIEKAQLNAAVLLQNAGENEEALNYFRLAATQGNPTAMREWARALLYGKGVESEPRQAIEILKKIAEKGDNAARVLLAQAYAGAINGVNTDFKKMIEYLWEAASQNSAEAQSKLGYCYEEGIGVTKDTEVAVKWYKKAAKKDHVQALINLGHCYATGTGVSLDKNRAFHLYKKAADRKFPAGLFNTGVCYAKGFGILKNEIKAEEHLLRAAELGDVNALYNLGVLYQHGLGVITPNSKKAYHWYQQSAKKQDSRGMRALTFLDLQNVDLNDEQQNTRSVNVVDSQWELPHKLIELSDPIED